MGTDANTLRKSLIEHFKAQGFQVNPHLNPVNSNKASLRYHHSLSRLEQIGIHRKRLVRDVAIAREHAVDGNQIDSHRIEPVLKQVGHRHGKLARTFFWWNFAWWSLPYQKPIGRQMRYVIWDEYHDAPMGLIGLQSPPLVSSIRDMYLGLTTDNREQWINQSMYAQRLGAIPPYNHLLGAKLAAMALVSTELRTDYASKYYNRRTEMKCRTIPNRLLFITTTGAYGKSSVYDRIRYKEKRLETHLGTTAGSGTFHLSERLFQDLIQYLAVNGVDTTRGYGSGPSRKRSLVSQAFRMLNLRGFTYHNIPRAMYLFQLVENLHAVIHGKEDPNWCTEAFSDLAEFWVERYCVPRSERKQHWRKFSFNDFMEGFRDELLKSESII